MKLEKKIAKWVGMAIGGKWLTQEEILLNINEIIKQHKVEKKEKKKYKGDKFLKLIKEVYGSNPSKKCDHPELVRVDEWVNEQYLGYFYRCQNPKCNQKYDEFKPKH